MKFILITWLTFNGNITAEDRTISKGTLEECFLAGRTCEREVRSISPAITCHWQCKKDEGDE
jgi:hypothetical protein